MKKVCVMALLWSIMLMIPAVAQQGEQTKEAQLLQDIGVFAEEAAMPDETVSRAQMCMIFVRLLGLENALAENRDATYFQDVPDNHWALAQINLMYKIGLVQGNGVNFEPEREMTFAETVKMLVCALGYKVAAESAGGYPAGYFSVAAGHGLLAGYAAGGGNAITNGQLSWMLYRALEVPVVQSFVAGETKKYILSDANTILEARGIKKAKGRVEASELTGLTPQSKRAAKGCVIIGGEEYEVGKTNAQEYLACKIEFYYRANEADKELVSIWGGKQERLTIAARDIGQNKQDESVIYYGEGKSARVADGAVILYNGRAAERTVKHLRPETGSLTLVDSQNSGVYDLVFVEEFQSFLVDGFSQRDEKIYLQDGSFLGEGYIDISHPGADGRIILPEAALAKNDAISVFASEDGKLLRITLQGNPARGEIASIQAGENIQVGDKTYSLAKQWQAKDNAALQPGDKVTLYFDHSGDVFYISPQKASINYGFPMAVQMKDAVSGTLQFKILTKDGEIKVFDATEKIRVEQGGQNAANLSGSELLQRLCPSGSLMKELLIYEVNADGKINSVTLPFDASNIDGKPSKEGQYSSIFSKDWNMDGSTGYYYAYGRLEDIRISDDTYVFAPAMKEDGTYDEKLATVTNRGYFSSSNNAVNFKMAIYDIDKGGTANAILVMDTATKGFAQEEWDVVVVDKIIPAIDKEGNEVKQLQGKQNGSPLSWTIAEQVTNLNLEENGTDEDIYQLKRGDVLIFELNIKGEIGVYQILYRKGQQKDGWIYAFGAGYGSVKATSMQVFAGTVEYLDDKVLKVKGTDSLTVFDVEGDFLVYECKQDRVVMSDMGSIQEGKTKLVAFGNRNSVTSVIIYQD